MPIRHAEARWEGKLADGKGTMKFGTFEGNYSFASRFEEGEGTNPEELIGAAHAGCYSMAFSLLLEGAGYIPDHIHTQAHVRLDKVDGGFKITSVHLETEARVPEIDEDTFQQQAEAAKKGCPVSQALTGAEISLTAKLLS